MSRISPTNFEIDISNKEAFGMCLDKIFCLTSETYRQNSMDVIMDELYLEVNKLFNEGKKIPNIINNFLSKHNKSARDVFYWLLSHKNKPEYNCILGFFYCWKIGTKRTKENVYDLFLNAAKDEDIAKFFVGKCYEEGWNVKKNKTKAIEWYIKAGECAAAGYALGFHYYKKQKYYDAFKWLKNSAEKRNIMALHTLGLCYQKGYGTKIDANKGFESFRQAAKMGLPDSQYKLAQCYEYGKGTEKGLDKASYWYQKAISNKYKCYNDSERVRHKLRNEMR